MKPYLIAIAGPSGSGKSTLAAGLAKALNSENKLSQASRAAIIFGLDDYYRDLAHLAYEERCLLNFDDPAQIASDELIRDITELAAGRAIERPVYDFSVHTRAPRREHIESSPYIIVEGLWTLYWAPLRELYAVSIYVESTEVACLTRRRSRDIAERGRTAESVDAQWNATVAPMAERYILPTRAFADIVISGTGPIARSVELILEHIRAHPAHSPKGD